MYLLKRLSLRWLQFNDEAKQLVEGFQLLIVNLAYIQLRSSEKKQQIVIVDSWREAIILWLLRGVNILPGYKVWVVRSADNLRQYAETDFADKLLMVATSRVFTKHYQVLSNLRQQRRLVVV